MGTEEMLGVFPRASNAISPMPRNVSSSGPPTASSPFAETPDPVSTESTIDGVQSLVTLAEHPYSSLPRHLEDLIHVGEEPVGQTINELIDDLFSS